MKVMWQRVFDVDSRLLSFIHSGICRHTALRKVTEIKEKEIHPNPYLSTSMVHRLSVAYGP